MLNAPEKPICLVERQHFIAWKKIQLTKTAQRFERARFLQERMVRPVDELKRLHHEFDLANAAGAKFDVAFKLVRSDDIALDASFDVGDLVEQIGCRAPRINERLMLSEEFVSQFPTAADSARLDQGEALPSFAETGIIIFHALERSREWSR